MRKFSVVVILASICAGTAFSHDLWVQPAAFWIPIGGTVPVSILVGHGKDRENWGVRSDRILLLRSKGPDGRVVDLKPLIGRGTAAAAIPLQFATPGTHLLAMQSSGASSDLPAARFNDFLKEEGLTPAIVHRQKTGATGRPGRELYSRRAKALLQVGRADPKAQSPATDRLGFTLEIVPERSPYGLGPAEALPIRVFYEGRPLSGALVKLTNLDADAKPAAARRTDRSGRAQFRIPSRGKWLLNVLWTKPVASNPKADYETIFSSLSFGYPA